METHRNNMATMVEKAKANDKKFKSDRNEVIFLGDVINTPVVNHIIDDDNGILIDVFYRFELRTKVVTNKGIELDDSNIPVLVSNNLLNELGIEIEEGKRLFIRGSFRVYEVEDEEKNISYNKQYVLAHSLEEPVEGTPNDKYINRFNFDGFLLEKLYKPKFDKNKKPILDPKTRRPIPDLDEEGKKQWTVIKKGEDVINDTLIAIKRHTNINSETASEEVRDNDAINKTFYIRCISYGRVANQFAKEIRIGQKISGSGYIRSRKFIKDGKEREVYEAVIVKIHDEE